MKVALQSNGLDRIFQIQTEKSGDFYTIGQISAKFNKQACGYPDGQKTVEIEMAEVLKELAE